MRTAQILAAYLRTRAGDRFRTRAQLLAWQDRQVQAHRSPSRWTS